MLPIFISALRSNPPEFPPDLRVERVQGTDGVWVITHAADGRARDSVRRKSVSPTASRAQQF